MFLTPQKSDSANATKAIKKRPSLVNLLQRHFSNSSSSPTTSASAKTKKEPASAPQPRSRSRKYPKPHFTTSAPEPRASRSTASLDTPPTSFPSSLLPPQRPSHRRSHSAASSTPTYISTTATVAVTATATATATPTAIVPGPPLTPSKATTYDDLFKSQNFAQTHRRNESESYGAVERKIWPEQHRYSQEIMKMSS